jgi:hypothetical protein
MLLNFVTASYFDRNPMDGLVITALFLYLALGIVGRGLDTKTDIRIHPLMGYDVLD